MPLTVKKLKRGSVGDEGACSLSLLLLQPAGVPETNINQGVVRKMRMSKRFIVVLTALVVGVFALPAFAASNPFMDVPANHWSYDAVAQLASRGVISGYPDGSYKGGQPATRYEMASTVARALAKIDMEKAGKQDLELLKKLVLELKDELDALGVKVDKVDSRLAVMEKDLGGWSMSGELRFDAKFGADENNNSWFQDDWEGLSGKNEFDLNQYRLYIMKRIDDKTTFTARFGPVGNNDGGKLVGWERYYIETMLPYDIKLTVGKQWIEWEGFTLGLAIGGRDYDAWMGNLWHNVFMLEKDWGIANLKFLITRDNDNGWNRLAADGKRTRANVEYFMFAGLANFNISEKLSAGLIAYYQFADKEVVVNDVTKAESDSDLGTYGIYFKYAFTPSIQLKGLYYHQVQGESWAQQQSGAAVNTVGYDDKAKAWKVMLDVKQDALKFTSLWLEYGQIDNNFLLAGSNNPYAEYGADVLYNQRRVRSSAGTAKVFGGFAEQKWNDKWSTFMRYFQVDLDTAGVDNSTEWSVGLAYQYSPAIKFELAYDKIDYGTGTVQSAPNSPYRNGDDNVVRFRTYVAF